MGVAEPGVERWLTCAEGARQPQRRADSAAERRLRGGRQCGAQPWGDYGDRDVPDPRRQDR